MTKQTGHFVISLDFELLWGVFDKVEPAEKKNYFNNTRESIPELLKHFETYGVSCTWAVVGMLFNKNFEEWEKNQPASLPQYEKERLSAYAFGKSKTARNYPGMCFAPDLIARIKQTPNQEIATHTYAHYYCLEPGQRAENFKADMEMAIHLAKEQGVSTTSLVFPRNQFNASYLKVCRELGITGVRTNPSDWYWRDTQSDSLSHKIFRTGDAYLGKSKSYDLSEIDDGKNPTQQKASRFLRPYSPKKFLNTRRLNRVLAEMTYAAKHHQVYHLWWHPHNFGDYPQESLNDLKTILHHYQNLKRVHNFASSTMEDIGKVLSSAGNGAGKK